MQQKSVVIVGIAVFVVHKLVSNVRWADVKADIVGSSRKALGLALMRTVTSLWRTSFYDAVAVRSAAKDKVPDKIAGLARPVAMQSRTFWFFLFDRNRRSILDSWIAWARSRSSGQLDCDVLGRILDKSVSNPRCIAHCPSDCAIHNSAAGRND